MTIVLAMLVLAAVLGGAVGALVTKQRKSFRAANEILPGTPSRAPAEWAGAHSPEALLHRRLRAAVESARTRAGLPGAGIGDVVDAVQRGALEIDDRLIAAAALPSAHRSAAIAAIEPSVIALENAVSGVSATEGTDAIAVGSSQPELDSAVADVQSRLDAVAAARDEVDQLDGTRSQQFGTGTTSPPSA